MNASDLKWRLELEPDCRQKQIDRILVTLMNCFPKCASVDLAQLSQMSELLEEEAYVDATSDVDFLHKVYVKLKRMEIRFSTTAGNHGMQSQVGNQRQSQFSLPNQYETQQQLATYDQSYPDFSAGAQDFATLPPTLQSMTSLTQTSVPNIAGLFNMQSGIAQDFVGSSVSQDLSSNIFSNTQWQMPDQLQQFSFQDQQLLQHQLMNENRLQPAQMSNDVGQNTNTQSGVAQYLFEQQKEQMLQQLMNDQNLLQPTQMLNAVQNLLQPTQMLNAVGRSTNTQSEIAHAQDLFQQQQQQQKQQQQQQLTNPQPFPSSMNSNAQIGENADDWKEEVYHKMKAMQQSVLPCLTQMYQKAFEEYQQLKHNVSVSNVPQPERQKLLDLLKVLDKHIKILNLSKDEYKPDMKVLLSEYEKKVMHVIKSNWSRDPVSAQQQIQQPVTYPLSTQPQQLQKQQQPQQQQQLQKKQKQQPQKQQQLQKKQKQQQEEEVDNQPHATHVIIDVPEGSD